MMGINNEIVFVEHCPPIFCRKIWYWQRLVFLRRANRPRPDITPIEITMPPEPPKLGKLKLTDYAADFKSIQLPKGEKLTSDDLEKTFDSFIRAVEA